MSGRNLNTPLCYNFSLFTQPMNNISAITLVNVVDVSASWVSSSPAGCTAQLPHLARQTPWPAIIAWVMLKVSRIQWFISASAVSQQPRTLHFQTVWFRSLYLHTNHVAGVPSLSSIRNPWSRVSMHAACQPLKPTQCTATSGSIVVSK